MLRGLRAEELLPDRAGWAPAGQPQGGSQQEVWGPLGFSWVYPEWRVLRPHSWGGGEKECPALGVQTSPGTGAGGCPSHAASVGNRREGKGEAQKLKRELKRARGPRGGVGDSSPPPWYKRASDKSWQYNMSILF